MECRSARQVWDECREKRLTELDKNAADAQLDDRDGVP
jgi:hypothetical protein